MPRPSPPLRRLVAVLAYLTCASGFSTHARVGRPGVSLQVSNTQSSQSPFYYRNGEALENYEAIDESIPVNSQSASVRTDRKQTSDINLPLIQSICLSQISLLGVVSLLAIAIGGPDILHQSLLPDVSTVPLMNGNPMPMAFFGTVPLIAMHAAIDARSTQSTNQVEFATNDLVISLFGRRRPKVSTDSDLPTSTTMDVMKQCLLLTLCTSVTEEAIYRFFMPLVLINATHSLPLALGLSAVIFGLAHTSPGVATAEENAVMGAQQTFNGLWYGVLNLVCGVGIVPSMIAHSLYDMHVLNRSWHALNDQIDWVEHAHPLSASEVEQLRQLPISRESLVFMRRCFYAFDTRHAGTLSLNDVQRAVTYCFDSPPTPAIIEETAHGKGQISLPDFIRIVISLQSREC